MRHGIRLLCSDAIEHSYKFVLVVAIIKEQFVALRELVSVSGYDGILAVNCLKCDTT
jgi:hypothetical protein